MCREIDGVFASQPPLLPSIPIMSMGPKLLGSVSTRGGKRRPGSWQEVRNVALFDSFLGPRKANTDKGHRRQPQTTGKASLGCGRRKNRGQVGLNCSSRRSIRSVEYSEQNYRLQTTVPRHTVVIFPRKWTTSRANLGVRLIDVGPGVERYRFRLCPFFAVTLINY